jgi:predicted RNA-binding protein YlqC (UPF0109 family)
MPRLLPSDVRSLSEPLRLNIPTTPSDTTEGGTVFRVTVAPPDVGKIIGKNGRTASSLRVLLSAMGVAAKKQYSLNIVVKS